jgi:succinate-semialdehyde dehydrogenase/glutarate-semialdehyde dehydrogenase
VVIKPATQTPFSALALVVLAEQAGIPAGVIQIVTGKSSMIGEVLTSDNRVKKLSFTGSTEVGRTLMAQCAPTIKKLSLELGGNAPFIVFDDADLEAAADGLIASKFRNAGQTCVCANRIYVQASVRDKFLDIFTKKVAALKVGNGMDEDVDIGPLINEDGLEKVQTMLQDALDKGAKVVTGGDKNDASKLSFNPTVVTNVTSEMDIAQEEIFGPIATIFTFEEEAEAIQKANDTIFGLAAYFYSRDYARSWRVTEALEYGIVGHNTGLISTEVAPFGGIKQSGFGREGSKYGIEEYVSIKYWCSAVS